MTKLRIVDPEVLRLEELIEDLLLQNPEYAHYQNTINKKLQEAGGDPEKRQLALKEMIIDANNRLKKAIEDLRVETSGLVKTINNSREDLN